MSEISFDKPDPHDFLDIDSLLSDEEILLRDTVRYYVEKEITPNVGDWWEEGAIPHAELAKDFGELGMFGMHLEGLSKEISLMSPRWYRPAQPVNPPTS